jgi:outer membrane lipoprotein carrier protein
MRSNCFRFCVLLVCVSAVPSHADDTEKLVARIVRAVEARYHTANTFKAFFVERRSEGKQSVQIEAGTLYIRRPGLMRWEYESPETKLFLVDGKFAWFYVPGDRTATRARVRDSEDSRIPLLLLAGKARLGRVCRRVELADVRVRAEGNAALRCIPAPGGEEEFRDAVFEVDAASRLVRLLIHEAGDVETEFDFDNWQENLPLDKSLFRFVPPKGTSIVDGENLLANPG